MTMKIRAKEIFLEDRILNNGEVTVENGIVTAIGEASAGGEAIELGSLKLCPGFLDIHIHGGNGVDSMDASYEAIDKLSQYKLKEGVTSFCPTPMTAEMDNIKSAVKNIASAVEKGVSGAKILGMFIEGPYISHEKRGAHPSYLLRKINLDEFSELISIGKGNIISFAIAPEIENAFEAIRFLREKGIYVRLGHTAGNYQLLTQAIEAGGSIGIHTYNAMSPFTHSEPGCIGAMLSNDDVYCEVICDLVHVHKAALKILFKCKTPEKAILITDCMRAGGLADGEYTLGEDTISVKDSIARTKTGNLAGSTVTLINAIKNVVNEVGIPLHDAITMATLTPAKALGKDKEVGSIAVGKKADMIAIDDDFNIKFVMVDGEIKILA